MDKVVDSQCLSGAYEGKEGAISYHFFYATGSSQEVIVVKVVVVDEEKVDDVEPLEDEVVDDESAFLSVRTILFLCVNKNFTLF